MLRPDKFLKRHYHVFLLPCLTPPFHILTFSHFNFSLKKYGTPHIEACRTRYYMYNIIYILFWTTAVDEKSCVRVGADKLFCADGHGFRLYHSVTSLCRGNGRAVCVVMLILTALYLRPCNSAVCIYCAPVSSGFVIVRAPCSQFIIKHFGNIDCAASPA